MEVSEASQNTANPFEEEIWSRKQYLDSARVHYLTALAGLSAGNQQHTNPSHTTHSSLLLEDNVCNQSSLAQQFSMPPQWQQGNAFFDMDVQMQLPNGVLKPSDRDLQAVKLQFSKTLAGNTNSQITELICELGSFGKEIDLTHVPNSKTPRTASSESNGEPLPRTVLESSSLHRMVESLKAELENLKKEHAELNDNDAGEDFAARNMHFSFFKSKPENGGCLAKKDKPRETPEKVTQDKDEVNDLNNKAKGLKRDLDAAKFSLKVEKRSRVALDVDETREGTLSLLDQVKSFPEGMHPACVSTSESSARIMISEDELESSSQQVGTSANVNRGTSIAPMGGVEGGKCDYASEFSIRDFVFAARNSDISHNWPFSEKNLQLCLKHGVKHVLPPFEPMDSLRDSSIKRCVAEKILHSEESNLHEKQSMMRNHITPGTILEPDHSWNQDLDEGYRDSDSFPTGRERDLAFKTNAAANSQSEVGSVSTSNLPLSEVSDEREAAGSAANNKTKSSASQLTCKKSKVAMKMRVNSKRNTPEDITSACTVPPETISSKICPVCESFSSSSNTTLNAHIDQCLSSQSPPIWMKSSKLMKPRIKPRKIRLMTDICATAPCCTLEDLDKRNGTNWATNVDFPLEEADVPAERDSPGVSSRYLLSNADDGSVYIDSSGRKIRILSKFNDMPPSSFSKAREDLRPKKQSGKGKRSKFFSSNRKKRFAKHLKFLKVTRQRKRSFSLKVKGRSAEACWPKEAVRAVGVRQQPASFVKGLEAQEQNHPGAVGSTKQCISLLKNSDSEAITKLSRSEVQATLIGSDEVEPRMTPVNKFMDLPKRFLSFTQSKLRTPAIHPVGVDQRREGSSRGKMLGGHSLRGAVRGNRDASQVSLNLGAAQINRKIVKGPKSSDSTTAPTPLCEREADIQPNVVQNAAISFPATMGLLLSCHVGPSEGMKSCNSKTMLSPNRYCGCACQANSDKLGSALENSCECRGDNEAEAWSADISHQSGAVIDHSISSRITKSLGRSSMVKVQQTQAMEYGQDVSNDSNSNDELTDDIRGNYGCVRSAIKGFHNDGEFMASVSSSGLVVGVNETNLRTAFDPELERVADVSPQSKLLLCSDKFQGPLFRNQPGLNDNHEMCRGNAVDAQRLDLKTGDYLLNFSHGSFFPEVDPIPIPGPPGSDLPSFSDMGSEDLHRSSLSSSLAQPLGDGDDVADGDLSESPFSAISAISNLGRSRANDVTVNKEESLNVYPGWFGTSPGLLPGISTVSSQFTAAESERVTHADNSEEGMVNLGGGAVMLNRDSEQCCCSQKEEITQSTMTSQDSQLLGWRPTSSTKFSVGNHTYSALDGQSIGLNDRSAVFSVSSCRREESVNLAHFVETSHQSITSLENSAEATDPFSRTGNCDSTIPSAPILRLMGKDLRVNRVDADFSRSQAAINVGMNKLVKGSWEPESSQSPGFMGSLHEQNPHYLPARHFDVGSSNAIHSFGSHNQASRGMYLNEHMHTSFSVLGAGPWLR